MSKSVLVIGGAGFLGAEITRALIRQGATRVGSADRIEVPQTGVLHVPIDVLDFPSVDRACQGFDVVINCVGQITKPINLCVRLNTEGMANLAKVVGKQKKRLIHISTVAVYGTADRVDESSPLNPESPYATCKATAEFLLRAGIRDEQLTILRLSNLYGEKQTKGLMGYLMRALHEPQKLMFDNDGSLKRYYLHVRDCANLVARFAEQPHPGTYNLIGPEQYTLKEIMALFMATVGRTFEVEYAPQAAPENIEKIESPSLVKIGPISYNHNLSSFFRDLT